MGHAGCLNEVDDRMRAEKSEGHAWMQMDSQAWMCAINRMSMLTVRSDGNRK